LVDLAFPRLAAGFHKTPVQTVRADYPHTAYRWSFESQHYAGSFAKKGRSGKRMVPRRRYRPRFSK
jgi:hypothetical protein